MRRFNTLLDAVSHLMRNGYRCETAADCQRFDGSLWFRRDSWSAFVRIQKNGRVAVEVL